MAEDTNHMLYVIPGWVYKTLSRNNLNNIDILEYSVIRQYMSIDDLAELIYLNNKFNINQSYLSNGIYSDSFKNLTQEQLTELTRSVFPLSDTDEIANNLKAKLESEPNTDTETYQFISALDATYTVLHEGFLIKIKDPAFRIKFIKEYLQECYKVKSIPTVSSTSMFKLYLKICKEL